MTIKVKLNFILLIKKEYKSESTLLIPKKMKIKKKKKLSFIFLLLLLNGMKYCT